MPSARCRDIGSPDGRGDHDPARSARGGGHIGVLHDLFANHVVAMLPTDANDGR